MSEPVPPTNSDTGRDKCEGLSTTSGGDAEVLRTWLQRMCCALAIPASSYFRGLKDRVTEVQQRSELPEGRGDRRAEGSSQEVFKMIFELRDNPLSMQSTYTLHWICIVTEMQRRDIAEKWRRDIAEKWRRDIAEKRRRDIAEKRRRDIAEKRRRDIAEKRRRDIAET